MKFKIHTTCMEDIKMWYPHIYEKYNLKVISSGDFDNEYEVGIKDLKTLMTFIKDIKKPIILFEDEDAIEIYDDWRE